MGVLAVRYLGEDHCINRMIYHYCIVESGAKSMFLTLGSHCLPKRLTMQSKDCVSALHCALSNSTKNDNLIRFSYWADSMEEVSIVKVRVVRNVLLNELPVKL